MGKSEEEVAEKLMLVLKRRESMIPESSVVLIIEPQEFRYQSHGLFVF